MAEGERTEESREPEGDSPEDERNETENRDEQSGDTGDGGGDSGDSDSSDSSSSGKGEMDDAPGGASVPADGVGDWDPPHESEDESKFSDVDAMGQEKRRTIIGQGYGPSRIRQLLYYGIAVAVIVALFIGASFAVDKLDKAPAKDPDAAPWAGTQVPSKQFE